MVASSVSIIGSLSMGIATTVCSSRRATLSCAPCRRVLAGIADDQLAPGVHHALQHALRNLQLIRAECAALRVARDASLQLARCVDEQQNAALVRVT